MRSVSTTTFIKDAFVGGFPIFESIGSWLALPIEEAVILDCGSTDGTRDILYDIERSNPRIRVIDTTWPTIERNGKQIVDAQSFALIMNQAIDACKHDVVVAYQADCVWPPLLLDMTMERWEKSHYNLSYWRVQLKHNWQSMKWFPHIIHSCMEKGWASFTGDGMNTNRTFDATLVSTWPRSWFARWGKEYEDRPTELPLQEMVQDTHANFDRNMIEWRKLHSPFWGNEDPDLIYPDKGIRTKEWLEFLDTNSMMKAVTSPYWIPPILIGCVGMLKYTLRDDLLTALKNDTTRDPIYEQGSGR